MSGFVTLNPDSLAWTNVAVGTSAEIPVFVLNAGDEQINLTGIDLRDANPVFTFLGAPPSIFPFTLDPGVTFIFSVVFTPTGTGLETDVVVVSSNAINNPTDLPLSGNGGAAGIKGIVVQPSAWQFANTKSGLTNVKEFTFYSSGGNPVTITGLVMPGGFTEAGAWPKTINPGDTYAFNVSFAPSGLGLFNGTVAITSDATIATSFDVSGVGYSINPAFILAAGAGSLRLVFGFMTTNAVAAIGRMNETSFACEDPATLRKTHLYPFPTQADPFPSVTYEKAIMRVAFHYTDKGVATVTVRAVSMRGQVSSDVVTFGTVGADGKVKLAWANLNVTDELVDVQFITDGESGPVEITDYIVKFEPKGERSET